MRPLALLAAALLAPGAASAQTASELIASGHVVVHARVEPAEVLVGQRATVTVEVLTRTWFPAAPRFPDSLDGDQVVGLPSVRGGNVSDRIGGEAMNGVSRRFDVFPLAAGAIETPAATVTVVTAISGATRSPELELSIPRQTIRARQPQESHGLGLVIATPALTADDLWEPDATELEVGDAITRTVTLAVEDSVALLLPELRADAPDGIAVYPARPELADARELDRVRGRRVESVTYVMERDGRFELPEQTIPWWNTRADRLETITLAARKLAVAPNPELKATLAEEAVAAEPDADTGRASGAVAWLLGLGAALLSALIAIVRRRRPRAAAADACPSEEALFHELRRAADGGDPPSTYAALMRWLDATSSQSGAATLTSLIGEHGDATLERECGALGGTLYGEQDAAWSPGELVAAVERARRSLRSRHARGRPDLGPLNPPAVLR